MAVDNGDGLSALEKKIIRQVEYYFGDMNLPRDKFLQEKIKEDDGWVLMDVMLNFNRLKQLSDDKEAICKALQKSESSLMEVNEDLTKIRRSPEKPLPDLNKERKDDITARSVYVKGFPLDLSLDTLMEFFEKHGKIESILMRREKNKEKPFKGSVFVTFASVDDESKFLEAESVKYDETELTKMKKDDYFKSKADEIKNKRKDNKSSEVIENAEKRKEEDEKKLEERMTKDAVLFVKGVKEGTTMEDVKNFWTKYGNVGWVEYAKGDEKALVRFNDEKAQVALDKAKEDGEEGKIIMNEAELETRILEGEEEKEYWRKFFREMQERNNRNKNKFGGGRGRGGYRGGRGGGGRGGGRGGYRGQKRGARDDGDGSPAKKAKATEGGDD